MNSLHHGLFSTLTVIGVSSVVALPFVHKLLTAVVLAVVTTVVSELVKRMFHRRKSHVPK